MAENILKVDIKFNVKKESEWSSADPVLKEGRIAISSDKYNKFKIGNGTSKWSELPYNRAIADDVSAWAKASTKPTYTKTEVGLSNVTNVRQIAGLSSGTTNGHVVLFGADGYTVKDSGFTIGKSVPSNAVFTDTVYTHPTFTAYASKLYKITTNTNGHVTAATAVTKADITALGIPAQDTTYSVATTSANGLMSTAMVSQLNTIGTPLTEADINEICTY